MTAAPDLYQLPVRCSFCGAPVRLRPTRAQVEKWENEPPTVLAHTYMCAWEVEPRRKCNNVIRIYAGDYQRATKCSG